MYVYTIQFKPTFLSYIRKGHRELKRRKFSNSKTNKEKSDKNQHGYGSSTYVSNVWNHIGGIILTIGILILILSICITYVFNYHKAQNGPNTAIENFNLNAHVQSSVI